MGKRLNLRISDEDLKVLEDYCKRTGATKTGAIVMLIKKLDKEARAD